MNEVDLLCEIFQMLINKDKYVAIGKDAKLLTRITSSLKFVAKENEGKEFLALQKQVLRNVITERYSKTETTNIRVQLLLADLEYVKPISSLIDNIQAQI